MTPTVPVVDVGPWLNGTPAERAAVARTVDAALQRAGFLLVTGHGVPDDLRAAVRRSCRTFFGLPEEVKRRYAVTIGGRGWLPPGVEANGYAEGTETPPDLKESFAVGADTPTGDAEIDRVWFPPNVWPAEVPGLAELMRAYLDRMRTFADGLLELFADALGQEPDHFTRQSTRPTYTMNANWYPPMDVVGEPLPGQFRIGPHTDFGTVTLLDREAGVGGLQVYDDERGWEDAPFVPGAYTVNIGDLLARWTGDRWMSGRHRVLPPSPDAPDEDLVSLVFFYEADADAVVTSIPPPVGRVAGYEPVVSADFLRTRLDAITLTPP